VFAICCSSIGAFELKRTRIIATLADVCSELEGIQYKHKIDLEGPFLLRRSGLAQVERTDIVLNFALLFLLAPGCLETLNQILDTLEGYR